MNRRRSNSQTLVLEPNESINEPPAASVKRNKVTYFITLEPLNDTFVKKHLSIPHFPETRKLGRPAGSKIKPESTNGFFDSRVLSRSHAALYVDQEGRIMLRDLGSSNGTYVNNEKLGSDPVEIKKGDQIFLGFNIQTDTNHKQISAKVEDINLISNISSSDGAAQPGNVFDSQEFQFFSFIQEIISHQGHSKYDLQKSQEPMNSFESAFFGDISNSYDFRSSIIGKQDSSSDIQSTSDLESIYRSLRSLITKIRIQNSTLETFESYIKTYREKVDELNSQYLLRRMEEEKNLMIQDLTKKSLELSGIDKKDLNDDLSFSHIIESMSDQIKKLKDEKEQLLSKLSLISDQSTFKSSPANNGNKLTELTKDVKPSKNSNAHINMSLNKALTTGEQDQLDFIGNNVDLSTKEEDANNLVSVLPGSGANDKLNKNSDSMSFEIGKDKDLSDDFSFLDASKDKDKKLFHENQFQSDPIFSTARKDILMAGVVVIFAIFILTTSI